MNTKELVKTETLEAFETELVSFKSPSKESIFTPEIINPILTTIRQNALSHKADLSTLSGRKEIASIAHKVSTSKTFLDGIGKEVVEEWKVKAKRIDSVRKQIRDTLDDLKVEVRQPLTEWEEKEKLRVDSIKSRISHMKTKADECRLNWESMPIVEMESLCKKYKDLTDLTSFEEFSEEASMVRNVSLEIVTDAIAKRGRG